MKLFKLSGFKVAMVAMLAILAVFWLDRFQEHPWTALLRLIEYKAYDFRFLLRGAKRPPDDVVILAIDEKSLSDLGQWPWPRRYLGKAIDILREDGALVVANDAVFPEPDRNDQAVQTINSLMSNYREAGLDNPAVLPEDLSRTFSSALSQLSSGRQTSIRKALEGLQEKLEKNASTYESSNKDFYERLQKASTGGNDVAYGEAVKRFPSMVLGYFFYENEHEVKGLNKEDYTKGFSRIEGDAVAIVKITQHGDLQDPVPFAKIPGAIGLQVDVPAISSAAQFHGYFNADQDIDGVIRWSRLLTRYEDHVYPSLGLQAILAAMRTADPASQIVVDYSPGIGVNELIVGGIKLPVDESGRLLINYYGPQKIFPHYSFSDVYLKRFEPGTFKDKIIFLGATAIGIYDLRTTPFEKAYPGVETHATVSQNILSGTFMQPADALTLVLEVGIIMGLSLFLGFFVPRVRALLGAAVSVVILIGIFAGNFYLFEGGHWISLIYPTLTVVIVYASITIYRYATEEKEKKQIKSAFGLYLHPAMVDQLAQHPDSLRLGGERLRLTAFFSDIAGFSTFSEKMQPEDLVQFLNEYLTEMTDILQKYDATVDKYIGDAIVAFYGAPLHFNDHAVKACLSTLDAQKRLNELREKWHAEGRPEVKMRIGLNTGSMVVGNMGSNKRFNYTMMGDSVNLAARLESGAKQYGVYTMIGEETEKEAREVIETRWLDYLVVKGRTKPVNIYELICKKGELDSTWQEVIGYWKKGVEAYRGRQFDLAVTNFSEVLRIRPGDGPAGVYVKRCENFKANPPPENWDGVYVATSK